ncbi:hypothetical protein DIZ81_05390 [Legionella taurinensis]|uniref:Protein with a bacterial immunoglobulin-like domain protein n=1 Tax=Legionella taurinensis TaxID=70611 RepID=A0A3A5LGF9_9GAMM|nr:hypothetical protein [Legionella taurinensis]MDX1837346.1 hypothetical protein [Legionella taurinensis]PUT40701.1 hypothetical protein DB744_05390 [Legionella taurinensis]PUT44123.1 hypothetical protein DB746_03790 [Legionella taurinensis]PUT47424.1 hypothetical protein DB743_01960 [Legionella taurinensis]PUT48563.1 hypothetical protein DB745_03790 [Legionella taurinensis]
MKKRIPGIFGFGLILLSALGNAGTQPKFSIINTVRPPALIAPGDIVGAQYLVTNNTLITRELTLVPLTGVQQITAGPNACQNPFVLAHGQSCFLNLVFNSNFANGVHNGPEICKTVAGGGNVPSQFLCSQPSRTDLLNITVQ